ncbi:hypothetical protein KPC83_07070 [Collinsella sp. zg1085]|uniref:hypothetical protein n=1 Tax=Collinsella sp. zg1085 TaxID=2844380 RepID=UPI001C0CD250|nr:hypothetical protein [Collinsella sp. zg1085]QWT17584.1 hypothetical protein KPC83_07070 [Collinsella sp. zg1085]
MESLDARQINTDAPALCLIASLLFILTIFIRSFFEFYNEAFIHYRATFSPTYPTGIELLILLGYPAAFLFVTWKVTLPVRRLLIQLITIGAMFFYDTSDLIFNWRPAEFSAFISFAINQLDSYTKPAFWWVCGIEFVIVALCIAMFFKAWRKQGIDKPIADVWEPQR